uniref:Uncharacterized protein n=1 Tax=Podoviridae sp. ctZkC8 TaxID=2825259 RepID=A0A8S5UBT1_9CAUD|nr:MAG TPA: hypothetical protein [Podoviridae sp. ctZkC8]
MAGGSSEFLYTLFNFSCITKNKIKNIFYRRNIQHSI